MPRAKKDNESLNIRIDSSINHMLARVSAESGQTKTIIVERALQAYFDVYYDKQGKFVRLKRGCLCLWLRKRKGE